MNLIPKISLTINLEGRRSTETVNNNCSLHITLPMEAYEYMTSVNCPSKSLLKVWKKMDKTTRLEYHLKRLCEHHRGKSYSYVILDE